MSELISGKDGFIYGIGVNEFDGNISIHGNHIYEYKIWKSMLRRCYSDKFLKSRPSYKGCSVDNSLINFSDFYKFVRGVFGFSFIDDFGRTYHLDKDLLGNGKIYSKETICFVPHEINAFLTNKKSGNDEYPVGVLFHKASGKLISQITINSKRKYLGLFDNPYDAFSAYKFEKEKHAKFLAEKYRDVVDIRVYSSLLSYEVNIND